METIRQNRATGWLSHRSLCLGMWKRHAVARSWVTFQCCLLPLASLAQGTRQDERAFFHSEVPATKGSVILARPTDHAITLSLLLRDSAKVAVTYARDGAPQQCSNTFDCSAGELREIILSGLASNAAYRYRVVDAASGTALLPEDGEGTFHTCRPPGSPFVFTVQADSHLDGNSVPEQYAAALRDARTNRPDFHIDLGDTFMTGKIGDHTQALKQYQAQRYYLDIIGSVAPVFLTIGNHDGEEQPRPNLRGGPDLNVWSCLQRKRFFPNPEPDAFYTGNVEKHPQAGLLENYYAWSWGDALFVVLDPYWTSASNRGGREPWNMTLGKSQYDWLARTLRESRAHHKFIFIHQLAGGFGQAGRGGAEAAALYEWGGREQDGSDTFSSHRQTWEKPIHALLVETAVSAVFHGHDHFYAQQVRDGVVYQTVPQPSSKNPPSAASQALEYGYGTGTFLPSPGYLCVGVSRDSVVIHYMRCSADTLNFRCDTAYSIN